MPGSYNAPDVLANTALEALKHAYEERQSPNAGTLILAAHEAISRLKKEINKSRLSDDPSEDPYEMSLYNSAV